MAIPSSCVLWWCVGPVAAGDAASSCPASLGSPSVVVSFCSFFARAFRIAFELHRSHWVLFPIIAKRLCNVRLCRFNADFNCVCVQFTSNILRFVSFERLMREKNRIIYLIESDIFLWQFLVDVSSQVSCLRNKPSLSCLLSNSSSVLANSPNQARIALTAETVLLHVIEIIGWLFCALLLRAFWIE